MYLDKNDFLCYFEIQSIEERDFYMDFISCKQSSLQKKYIQHSHGTWEIVCQLEGEVRTQVNDKVFVLSPHDIMLIPPNTPHRGSSEESFRDLSLLANGMDFGEFKIIKDYRGDISNLMSMICRIYTEQEGNYGPLIESLTQALRQMIHHEIGVSGGSPAVEGLKKEIYENLSNGEFDLAQAVEKTGFDKDYFRRCFKKETGKTPTQYLIDLRITHAKQLLADSKLFSISSIADSCGFLDSFYFSTCFKKHVGISPVSYRKELFDIDDPDRL